MSKVDILINCYNGEKYLEETLASVRAQTFTDWTVIFIDNCSTDRTAEIAKNFDARLQYYRTPQFMSLCEARVWAKPFLKSPYFSALDSDDLIRPDKLARQVAALDANPAAGFCYTNSLIFSDSESHPYYTSPQPSGRIFEAQLTSYSLSLETLMLRRSTMDKHNLFFDPRYNIANDLELMLKMSYVSEGIYLDEILAQWRYGHVSESVRQMESFPRETEILIEDLKSMIPDLEVRFAHALKILRSRIENMYGLSAWQKGDVHEARRRFWKAASARPRYALPLVMSWIAPYEKYRRLRQAWTRV